MAVKVLICILSSEQPPYDMLMQAQMATWDQQHQGVDTVYYFGGEIFDLVSNPESSWRNIAKFNVPDNYHRMHEKFRLALSLSMNMDWDIMFRTNSSCYVNKPIIQQFVKALPTKKLYAGYTLEDSNDDGGLCVSGAGIFLSRDCAKILSRKIPEGVDIEEDVLVGRILRQHGMQAIDDRSRIDYPAHPQYWNRAYHVRFKSENRLQDAANMLSFHKKIQS